MPGYWWLFLGESQYAVHCTEHNAAKTTNDVLCAAGNADAFRSQRSFNNVFEQQSQGQRGIEFLFYSILPPSSSSVDASIHLSLSFLLFLLKE